ncbi:CD4-1 molecule isoform X4 [Misgurnus anguillicaudatus]|uniref:CD4-1 molecule isoform X4 n=1 Tax=Misgurnus anguillicaudatus TaxID=75329 RepID=UPI003CCFC59E
MMLCWILILLTLRFLKAEEIEIYAQEGGTVTLPRDLHGGDVANTEKVYVNWYSGTDKTLVISRNPQAGIQPGKDKTRFSMLSDFSVQISPVHESDFGIFSCEQHILTQTYTKTYRLRRVTVSRPQPVMVGNSLSLKCKLETGQLSGTASVKWTPPKGCNANIQGLNGEITVPKVPVCASGVWTCTVKYNKREVKATTAAYVIDLSAPSDPIYTSVSNSSSVNIPCSLSNDIPWDLLRDDLQGGSWSFSPLSNANQQPLKAVLTLHINSTIKWIPTKDAPIAVQQRELKDKDLSIIKLPVSEAIRGEYTCALNFEGRTFSKKITVEVLQVTSTATRSPLIEGQRVNLSCSLGHNTTHEVKWRHPSGSTHPLLSSSPHSAFLTFPVRMEDKGKWTCELWDDQKLLTFSEIALRIDVDVETAKNRFCCCKNPNETGFYKT